MEGNANSLNEQLLASVNKLIEEGSLFTFENFCYFESAAKSWAGSPKPEWIAWKTRVMNLAQRVATPDSAVFKLAKTGYRTVTNGYGINEYKQAYESLMKALHTLKDVLQHDEFLELNQKQSHPTTATFSNKIFIVHGHDSTLKTDTELFIKEIGLEPIVLHRKPDESATVIEKFEKYSDVGYAFVLLTPDEIAYTMDQEPLKDIDRKKEKRARPNVIFELGFFVGRLGRNRVCCLYKGNVEVPSDLKGLLHKKVESSIEPVAYSIIKELKAAGYQI